MKLRQATKADIPEILDIGTNLHGESRYAGMPYDRATFTRSLEGLFAMQERGKFLILVTVDSEGHIFGGLIGGLESNFFTTAIAAKSMLIWVHPKYRGSAAALRLVSAFKDWAQKKGAVEVCILVSSGVTIGRTDRFVRRLGYKQSGGNYYMPLTGNPAAKSTSD